MKSDEQGMESTSFEGPGTYCYDCSNRPYSVQLNMFRVPKYQPRNPEPHGLHTGS